MFPPSDQNTWKSVVYLGGVNVIDYSWILWLEELAAKIVEGGEDGLIAKAKEIAWEEEGAGKTPALLKYYEEHGDKAIDPFSFLYSLAGKATSHQYERVFRSIHEIFGIDSAFPSEGIFIPRPYVNLLFHGGPTTFNPKVLWRLYKQAVRVGAEPAIQPGDFNAALAIPEVGISKLTQTLFIANPRYFLPVDKTIRAALPKLDPVKDYESYLGVMGNIMGWFPGCHPYEINTFLSTQASKYPLIAENTDFFQVSTNVYDDGIDYWEWNDEWEEDQTWAFNQKNCVYTGDPEEQETTYPLAEPKRGDVILVRFGGEGRAIGVVEENRYDPEGWNEDGVIYVHWINKTPAEIESGLPNIRFSRAAEATQTAFRNTDAYAPSFDLIDRWTSAYDAPSLFDSSVRRTREGDSEAPPAAETSPKKPDTSLPLNTILFGPPGTGKTWEAVSWAVAIVDGKEPEELVRGEDREDVKARYDQLREKGRVELVTFHQSYAYEDFVEGIGPILDHKELLYELRDGIFKRISSRAHRRPNERFVLVIDEINRGNIARIFGELITLIEPSKRAGADDEAVAILPYSRKPFSVPGNLYLVGTMNTADRGIALLDSALRRRFDFVEKMPNVQHIEINEDIEGVNGRDMLRAINDRITVYLDREHQIGHTYLLGVKTIDRLKEAFQRRIVPLLQEYFYDDWAKIRSVLNGNPFIHERLIEASIPGDRPERPVFEVLAQDDEQWTQADSYQQIYTRKQAEGAD